MIKHYIDIDGFWGIVFCYNYSQEDELEMAGIMDSFGLDNESIADAIEVLSCPNTGMTISRSDITMSVIFVSRATSKAQFMDTITHEVDHAQYAIERHYYVACGTEDAAWLQGYIMRGITRALEKDGVI